MIRAPSPLPAPMSHVFTPPAIASVPDIAKKLDALVFMFNLQPVAMNASSARRRYGGVMKVVRERARPATA